MLRLQSASWLERARRKHGRRQRGFTGQRGFTLAEMLTVITVISILAAAAAPSFIRMMKDRRVRAAANEVADLYRGARARAMGRGSAVTVRFNQTAFPPSPGAPYGHFLMREAVVGTGPSVGLPSTSCIATDWTDTSINSRPVRSFDERRPQYNPAAATFIDPGGSGQSYAEICFTPRGRTFVRFSSSGAFAPMNGVPHIDMINLDTTMRRRIILPPSGVARVVTQI